MTVRVRAARSAADLDTWVAMPRRSVYEPESPWVPPLDGDLKRFLNRDKNPFFLHGDAVPLLATDERGQAVGRILAHISHRHNARHGERASFFGYFESMDDRVVAAALVQAAARYGQRLGSTVLRGPFNMTAMQEMGILEDGFDEAPAVDETYTAPYYPALLAAAGWPARSSAWATQRRCPERRDCRSASCWNARAMLRWWLRRAQGQDGRTAAR